MRTRLYQDSDEVLAKKSMDFGGDTMRSLEKQVLLHTLDKKWREHLVTLEHLRSVIGFRGYAQRDPLNEFKNEAFGLFESLLNALRSDVSSHLSIMRPLSQEEQEAMMRQLMARRQQAEATAMPSGASQQSAQQGARAGSGRPVQRTRTGGAPGRNSPCPCGSGKKYKHCHGRRA